MYLSIWLLFFPSPPQPCRSGAGRWQVGEVVCVHAAPENMCFKNKALEDFEKYAAW